MNAEEFKGVFNRVVEAAQEVLVEKARQYADDTDRLHNFKVAAAFEGITEEQALWGMQTKHLVSISDMVRKNEFYPPEVWDEKIGDALNYLILLRAQVYETDGERSQIENGLPSDFDLDLHHNHVAMLPMDGPDRLRPTDVYRTTRDAIVNNEREQHK